MRFVVEAFAWIGNPEHWGGPDGIVSRVAQHLGYSALALFIAAVVAIPFGLYIGHTGRFRVIAVALLAGARALPSLGLLTFLAIVLGFGLSGVIVPATVALVVGTLMWLSGRDWRYSVPVLATLAAWLPWIPHSGRPIFFFYAIMMVPFTVICLALALGRVLGPADHPKRRRRAILVGLLAGLIVLNFAFIYPVLTDELMTRPAWLLRMWLPTWI